jgi:hypothetical protein
VTASASSAIFAPRSFNLGHVLSDAQLTLTKRVMSVATKQKSCIFLATTERNHSFDAIASEVKRNVEASPSGGDS